MRTRRAFSSNHLEPEIEYEEEKVHKLDSDDSEEEKIDTETPSRTSSNRKRKIIDSDSECELLSEKHAFVIEVRKSQISFEELDEISTKSIENQGEDTKSSNKDNNKTSKVKAHSRRIVDTQSDDDSYHESQDQQSSKDNYEAQTVTAAQNASTCKQPSRSHSLTLSAARARRVI